MRPPADPELAALLKPDLEAASGPGFSGSSAVVSAFIVWAVQHGHIYIPHLTALERLRQTKFFPVIEPYVTRCEWTAEELIVRRAAYLLTKD